MAKIKNLQGLKFGKLQVLSVADHTKNNTGYRWNCKCDCGRIVKVRVDNLQNGHSTQCVHCARNNRRKKVMEYDMEGEQ